MLPYFSGRTEAGKSLAKHLLAYKDRPGTLVLALPRGGVPVGYEIAKALHVPLDLMLVRKLGVPGHEEFAMGAIASDNWAIGNVLAINENVVRNLGISRGAVERVIESERVELTRRNNVYRAGKGAPELKDKTVILVDDGCATGANMRAAAIAARKLEAAKIIVAVPIASDSACESLSEVADEIVCGLIPPHFTSLGAGYDDFRQLEDQEVIQLLKKAERRQLNHQTPSRNHEPVSA